MKVKGFDEVSRARYEHDPELKRRVTEENVNKSMIFIHDLLVCVRVRISTLVLKWLWS
jgi:hypothetical protein